MGYFSTGRKKVFGVAAAAVVVILLFAGAAWVLLPDVAAASASYDCDDASLAMYRHFASVGLSARPVAGNLQKDGEDYADADHVWLLVNALGREIAWDWGMPRFDTQHYEGYELSLDDLLTAVAADGTGGNDLLAATR